MLGRARGRLLPPPPRVGVAARSRGDVVGFSIWGRGLQQEADMGAELEGRGEHLRMVRSSPSLPALERPPNATPTSLPRLLGAGRLDPLLVSTSVVQPQLSKGSARSSDSYSGLGERSSAVLVGDLVCGAGGVAGRKRGCPVGGGGRVRKGLMACKTAAGGNLPASTPQALDAGSLLVSHLRTRSHTNAVGNHTLPLRL